MSDVWRELEDAVANAEPPLDLWTRVLDREAQLAPARRLGRFSRRGLTLALAAIGCCLVLGALAIAAHSRGQAEPAKPTPAPPPCIVGSNGCGPLPTLPTQGVTAALHTPCREAPRNGSLRPGAYSSICWNHAGVHLGFNVPAGWSWHGRTLSKGNAAVSFYVPPVLVYADPCHWDRPQHPVVRPALASGDVIINELAAQPMRYATRPQGLSVDMSAIRLTVPSNLDVSRCDHGEYRTWGSGANTLLAQGPGQRDLIWISYLGLTPAGPLIVDATTFPTTPTRLVHQVDTILASVSACMSCG